MLLVTAVYGLSLIHILKGTKAEDVINVLLKIDADKRNQVKEITLDMAGSMQKIYLLLIHGEQKN